MGQHLARFWAWRRQGHCRTVGLLTGVVLAGVLLAAGCRFSSTSGGVTGVLPAVDQRDVSTGTTIRVTLNRPPDAGSLPALALDPAVEGQVHVDGCDLVFVPTHPLEPATTYTVTLPDLDYSWRFATAPRQILYLAPDPADAQVSQLYLYALDTQQQRQLTDMPLSVRDYAVSPDGAHIAYTVYRDDGGEALRLMARDGSQDRLLWACPGAACREAVWWPDGSRLLVQRHAMVQGRVSLSYVELWTVDPADGMAAALSLPRMPGDGPAGLVAPRVSADGRWLAALDAVSEQVVLYDLAEGEPELLPGQAGTAVAWHPQRNAFLLSRIELLDEAFGVALFVGDLSLGQQWQLTGGLPQGELLDDDGGLWELVPTEDLYAAWSPDGSQIAFGRRIWGTGMPTARQVYLLPAPSPGEATYQAAPQALTDDPQIQHGAPHWSPDGRLLLYSRHRWAQPGPPELLGLLDVATGAEALLPVAGHWPAWLP